MLPWKCSLGGDTTRKELYAALEVLPCGDAMRKELYAALDRSLSRNPLEVFCVGRN